MPSDPLSKQERSLLMGKVRSKNTKPEMIVRKLVFGFGYRYRLHTKELPGRPDLVFRGRRKLIFVHGCFWHGHDCTSGTNRPKSNTDYWQEKLNKNKLRDESDKKTLEKMGWDILVVWECELKNLQSVSQKIKSFLK
jgi:DNA mismatch endonuclease (patch repair protein)